MNRMVVVPGNPQTFPVLRLVEIPAETSVEIGDSARAMPEGVMAQKAVKAVIDPLPVEGWVVGDEDRAPFHVLLEPSCKGAENFDLFSFSDNAVEGRPRFEDDGTEFRESSKRRAGTNSFTIHEDKALAHLDSPPLRHRLVQGCQATAAPSTQTHHGVPRA